MAVRGPKPVPASIVHLFKDGIPKFAEKGGEQKQISQFEALVPEPPKGDVMPSQRLGDLCPEALEYFRFYSENVGVGHLKPLDRPMLERLCETQAALDKVMEKWLNEPSLVQTNIAGMQSVSPYFVMMAKLGEMARKLSIELALTPVERSRVKGGAGNSTSPEERERANRMAELRDKYVRGSEAG